jgi:hypothetical protein
LGRAEVETFLAKVARRKFEASGSYPAGIAAGAPFERKAPRTPYFDASDIAAPCCGAAATIVTSDEELVARVDAARPARYRAVPLTEVLGVGEGSSSENVLHRPSPLLFATAVREALADTADDAHLPLSAFRSAAFGVAHDAFPSIELSFTLAMGLPWERSAERIMEGWSNPFGGLLTFGHALGASGLVQVNKAHHLFCGDRRHVKEASPARSLFHPAGAIAFTTSVGGPLSHIVAGLFRGGFTRLPAPEQALRRGPNFASPLTHDWWVKRHQLRRVVPAYLKRLRGRVPGEPWLLEGVTYVSIRSALRALSEEDLSRLAFDGLEQLLAPEHLRVVRDELREAVRIVIGEADRVASMFDAFRMLTEEVLALSKSWRAAGMLKPGADALSEAKLAERVKECLRVPIAVVHGASDDRRARRRLLFLPAFELNYELLQEVDLISSSRNGHDQLMPVRVDSTMLPFWYGRATRPERPPNAARIASPKEIVDQILGHREGPESAAELQLLRIWFQPDPPRPVLEQALRAAGGFPDAPAPRLRVHQYVAEVIDRGTLADPAGADELLGRAAREAVPFLEPYESTAEQVGEVLVVAAFERPPFGNHSEDGILKLARFAREVAQATLEHRITIRAAICAADGALFEDASGRVNLASPSRARAAELLRTLSCSSPGSLLAVETTDTALREAIQQRMTGWKLEPSSQPSCAVWRKLQF